MAKITPDARFKTGYFFHVAKHAETYLKSQTNGTGIPHVDRELLEAIRVFCPAPAEQLRLAEILDHLDTSIHETEAIIAKLKAVKQGLLHDLLTRGIDANGELRPLQSEAPHLYKQSALGWIPKVWGLKPLGKILAEPTKNGLYKPSQFHGRGPLMVQMGGLFAGDAVTFGSATRVQVTPFEFNTFGLAEGDLLFARRSLVFEGAGQCVIVRNLAEPATFESSIVRARVRRDEADPEFVCQYLRDHRSNAQRRTLIRQVAVSGVSGADIRELLIALPSLEEQGGVITRLQEVQTRINLELESVAKLRSQKTGLMDDLLTGRVRVTPLLEGVTS
jgi:type I restriction enzyme S subunit